MREKGREDRRTHGDRVDRKKMAGGREEEMIGGRMEIG